MENKKLKSIDVVGAAIVKDGLILCAKRGYGPLTGQWEFPGGKIELGETPEQALIREIKEELNVDIKVNKYVGTSHYDYPTFHINLSIFECEIISGQIDDHEHTSLKWIKREELDQLDWCPADIVLIANLK